MSALFHSAAFTQALAHLARLQDSQNDHLEILFFLDAEGGSVPRAELEKAIERMDGNPTAYIKHLSDAGLVQVRRLQSAGKALPVITLQEELKPLLQLPLFYRNRLRKRLAGRELSDLRQMAEGFFSGSPRELSPDSRNAIDVLASIKALLLDSAAFKAAVEEHFDATQRVVFKILSMFPQGITLRDLRKHLTYFGHPLTSDEVKHDLMQIFRMTGMVWTTEGDSLLKHDQYFPAEARVMLVQDVIEMVKSNYALPNPPRQIYPAFSGDVQPEAWKVHIEPGLVFQNALTILIYLVGHRVSRIQKGGVHKSEVKRISTQFSPPQEDHYLFNYLFDYFEQYGIVRDVNGVWGVDLARAVAFFANPTAQLNVLLTDYFGANISNKEQLVNQMESMDSGVLDPLRVAWLLHSTSQEAWVTCENLAFLYAQGEGGFRSDQHKAQVEKFVHYQLEKPLFWFGLIELSHHPEKGTLLFRFSDRGRSFFFGDGSLPGLEELYIENEKLLVQANLEVFLPACFSPKDTLFLARFADFSRSRFRLSTQSLSRGLDSGLDLEVIRSFIDRTSSQELPQNVSYMLEEVSSKHGHVMVDPRMMVLKTEDPILSKELSLIPALKRFYLARFSDDVLLIAPGVKVSRLVEELRRLGYMPRVQWDAVIDDGADSFALDGKEKLALLSLLRAYEYTESLHLDLAEYLRTVSAQLNEDDQKACKKIPQRQLKDSYKKIEAMSTAIKTGKLM
jgi:hypothetical protein